MPIRIKPSFSLPPCVLYLDGITGICELINLHFEESIYVATDGFWEVYDADAGELLSAIRSHKRLDSLRVSARGLKSGSPTHIFSDLDAGVTIIFDDVQARVDFEGGIEHQHWLEHFLIDLKKHLSAGTLYQRIFGSRTVRFEPGLSIPLFLRIYSGGSVTASTPYCRLVIHKQPPSPFVENIKANLASNLIWSVAVFIGGLLFAVLCFWVLTNYGVDIQGWIRGLGNPSSGTPP